MANLTINEAKKEGNPNSVKVLDLHNVSVVLPAKSKKVRHFPAQEINGEPVSAYFGNGIIVAQSGKKMKFMNMNYHRIDADIRGDEPTMVTCEQLILWEKNLDNGEQHHMVAVIGISDEPAEMVFSIEKKKQSDMDIPVHNANQLFFRLEAA